MKKAVFAIPLLLSLAGYGLTGCATQHTHAPAQAHKPVYVAPWGAEPVYDQPAPRNNRDDNVLGAPPGSHLNWIDGYWAFVDWHWFWVPGHWEEHRPSQAGVWMPGQWDRRQGQWLWRPGHWEQP